MISGPHNIESFKRGAASRQCHLHKHIPQLEQSPDPGIPSIIASIPFAKSAQDIILNIVTGPSHLHKPKSVQSVFPIVTRALIINLMQLNTLRHDETGLLPRTVRNVSEHFRASSQTNSMPAMRLWRERPRYDEHCGTTATRGVTTSMKRVTKID